MINNTFVIDYFVHDYATKPVDIRLAAFDGDIVFINNKRFIYCGDINYHYESGIAVYVDELYKNHYINVPFAKISNKKLIQEKILSPFNSTIESIKKVINTTKYKGTINKKYYYALVAVVDENRKLATGFTKTAKISTSSTGSNIIIPNFDFKGLDVNFRIYKGTTSSKFEKVSDIANAAGIVDNEVSVNGFGWRDNSTGVVETYNECQGMEYINLGNNVLVYAKTLPTVGTWKANDRCVLLGNGTSDNGGTYRYNGSTWVKL